MTMNPNLNPNPPSGLPMLKCLITSLLLVEGGHDAGGDRDNDIGSGRQAAKH
jgi:hypothetical protein